MSHTYLTKPGLGPLCLAAFAVACAFGCETGPFGYHSTWLGAGR